MSIRPAVQLGVVFQRVGECSPIDGWGRDNRMPDRPQIPEPAAATVVVVANFFNPSVVSQLWLVRNGLLTDDELPANSGSIFSDTLVQVVTPRYTLLVTPDQLQFMPVGEEGAKQLILDKLGLLVGLLPHTPFRALGLNFSWQFKPADGSGRNWMRRLFFRPDSLLYGEFDTPDAHFGGYLSRDVFGMRLKLDVRPLSIEKPDGCTDQVLQMLYNFHADIRAGDGGVATVHELLGRWDDSLAEARRLQEIIMRRGVQ